MKKLSLNLDQLTVDSFDTVAAEPKKGTVFGEQCTCYTQCTCPGCPTCYHTCNQADHTCGPTCETCDFSCGGSCWYTECPTTGETCNPSNLPGPCCPW
jgi:hypothetical protein